MSLDINDLLYHVFVVDEGFGKVTEYTIIDINGIDVSYKFQFIGTNNTYATNIYHSGCIEVCDFNSYLKRHNPVIISRDYRNNVHDGVSLGELD